MAGLEGARLISTSGQYPLSLREAKLKGAKLRSATLSGAALSRADLSGAIGITNEELEHQAESLEGTIMPDGSNHPCQQTSENSVKRKSNFGEYSFHALR
jgi:uncharacterized protein YjbI with pentapeptide repeats